MNFSDEEKNMMEERKIFEGSNMNVWALKLI